MNYTATDTPSATAAPRWVAMRPLLRCHKLSQWPHEHRGQVMKQYLRDYELAERWGVHRRSIWRWAKSGAIPGPIRIGGNQVRWALTDIEEHEARKKRERRSLAGPV